MPMKHILLLTNAQMKALERLLVYIFVTERPDDLDADARRGNTLTKDATKVQAALDFTKKVEEA